MKPKWFEEYACGCTSPGERLKRDLLGYCPKHGDSRRNLYRETETQAILVQRIEPVSPHQETKPQ